ncbi:PucR family transcriptional regulator [Clostridium tyrobutyricum]|uniref:PucR family transcriptional regulator n=1 Tax=Clostridium tyrobutyricum TaxID=1519 RepID=UPI002B203DB4|nr:PucR family transcriptional regulator ligand-binding domain-containing protein [Clostridium tyrobutyricum]MEA5009027.1 PucR family transcriptional regulator ligand-binding domain-containing protein [Clostridium tyrobutyricum]
MIINCGNIKTLNYADKLKLVAGKNGLDRVIKWVHFMENPEYIDWLKGGELILITGVLMDMDQDMNTLLKLITDLNFKNASGLVINIGPYIDKTPLEAIKLADSLDFPIFELPFELRLIDISQSICKAIFLNRIEQESMNSFMKNILSGDLECNEETVNRAMFYGYNSSKRYCSFVVSVNNFTKFAMNNGIWDEEIVFRTVQQINQVIVNIMNRYNENTIRISENNIIIIMIPVEQEIEKKMNNIAEEIIKNIHSRIKGLKISIGIGTYCSELGKFKESIDNAKKALKILKVTKDKSYICNYNDIGVYRLLFEIDNMQEMKKFYYEVLGKLVEYDKKNTTKLVRTLNEYIKQNCNLIKTANVLFIHKNTLKYRIKRIEEILDCDLKDMENLLNFSIAFKIKNL